MRYLSLFSGIEAASLAWEPLGWEAVAFAEVDPFASAVLAHRYPSVPNLGDVCGVGPEQLDALGKIDVVIFGSPCTDFSLAGKKEGIKDKDGNRTRSGLFEEAVRIVRLAAERNGLRWFIMENVPGMLSTNGGSDFCEVIREICGCTFPVPSNGWRGSGVVAGEDGGWSLAWRTLDAKYFGVPQQRRRVFLVGHLGHWTNPAAVLFVGQSLSRNSSKGGKTGKDYTRGLKGGTRGGGGQSSSDGQEPLIAHSVRTQDRRVGNTTFAIGEDAVCLRGEGHGGGHAAIAYQCQGTNVGPMGTIRSGNGNSTGGVPFLTHEDTKAVRRLLPAETERLQGMPTGHTDIPYDKAGNSPDTQRYRAIGNSFAVPVVRWLGKRLQEVMEVE